MISAIDRSGHPRKLLYAEVRRVGSVENEVETWRVGLREGSVS